MLNTLSCNDTGSLVVKTPIRGNQSSHNVIEEEEEELCQEPARSRSKTEAGRLCLAVMLSTHQHYQLALSLATNSSRIETLK